MKNMVKLFGIIALVAVIGLSMTACDPEGDGNGNGNGDGSPVSISGTPKVGEKLTAASSGSGWSGDFEWSYAASRDATFWTNLTSGVAGDNNNELTVPESINSFTYGTIELVGKYIRVSRFNSSSEQVWSDPVGPIQAASGGGDVTWSQLKGTKWIKTGQTSIWIEFPNDASAQYSTLKYHNGTSEFQNTIMSFSANKITTSKENEQFNVGISNNTLTISNWVESSMNGSYAKE